MDQDLTIYQEDDDFCAECSSLGDDFYIDENGELENACYDCPIYLRRKEQDIT